jgi:capsular exopolysaccharide synthesis family protein
VPELPPRPPNPPEDSQPVPATQLIPSPLTPALRARPVSADSDYDDDDAPAGVSFAHRLWVIRRNLWVIISFAAFCTIATAVISYRLTPIYESTVTIDVDRRAPTGVVGQDANSTAANDTDQFLNTQVRLIQSDAVLKQPAQEFGMNKTPGSVGMSSLTVTRPNATFLILINYRSPDPTRAAAFANAVAASYIEQTYNIRYKATLSLSTFMEKQIEELRAKMEKSSDTLTAFERELNMIRPEETNGIVSARLLQLNTEYTTAQSDRVKKQASWESLESGNLAAAEVSDQGESLRRLADQVDDAREKNIEAQRVYGKSHPEYKKASEHLKQLTDALELSRADVIRRAESEYREAANREAILEKAVQETKAEFDRLNARAFQYQNLKREAEDDRKLYEELSNRIKEAGINAGFQNSSIRIADQAQPSKSPVYPNVPRNIEMALLASLALGIVTALFGDAMDATLRSPEDVERTLGTHVIGILPLVKKWSGGWLSAAKPGAVQLSSPNGKVPAASRQTHTYEDAVQTLRDSILLSAFGQPLRTLMVTSASPAEGKTTTAAHLAISHAHQKLRTLLIECDLRRPGMRIIFGLENGTGLSHVLSGEYPWREQIVRREGVPGLDILPAGAASRRDADLIGRAIPRILREATAEYDLIVLDSPPLLGFAEPLHLASAVDGVVLVALAGKTNRKAVASAITTLHRLRVNLIGVVLNEVTRNTSADYYHYGYYGKYYGGYAAKE